MFKFIKKIFRKGDTIPGWDKLPDERCDKDSSKTCPRRVYINKNGSIRVNSSHKCCHMENARDAARRIVQ